MHRLTPLLALAACAGPTSATLEYRSGLDLRTEGVVLHADGETGHAGLSATNCPFETRRGMVTGAHHGTTGQVTVRGQVPMSELTAYQSRLNALTSGQGRYTIALSHHEAVPASVQQQLTSAHSVSDED